MLEKNSPLWFFFFPFFFKSFKKGEKKKKVKKQKEASQSWSLLKCRLVDKLALMLGALTKVQRPWFYII